MLMSVLPSLVFQGHCVSVNQKRIINRNQLLTIQHWHMRILQLEVRTQVHNPYSLNHKILEKPTFGIAGGHTWLCPITDSAYRASPNTMETSISEYTSLMKSLYRPHNMAGQPQNLKYGQSLSVTGYRSWDPTSVYFNSQAPTNGANLSEKNSAQLYNWTSGPIFQPQGHEPGIVGASYVSRHCFEM